jgi:hypothetical protein
MLRGEATNTNFIVFGFTRPGLEPTIYRTRGEHAKLYAPHAVNEKKTGKCLLVLDKIKQYWFKVLPVPVFLYLLKGLTSMLI